MPRATYAPPDSLAKLVFPWVEQWDERILLCKQGKDWAEGGLDQEDMALEGFISLMKYLRIVLLQDMAVLQAGKYTYFSTSIYPTLLMLIQTTQPALFSRMGSSGLPNGTSTLNSYVAESPAPGASTAPPH